MSEKANKGHSADDFGSELQYRLGTISNAHTTLVGTNHSKLERYASEFIVSTELTTVTIKKANKVLEKFLTDNSLSSIVELLDNNNLLNKAIAQENKQYSKTAHRETCDLLTYIKDSLLPQLETLLGTEETTKQAKFTEYVLPKADAIAAYQLEYQIFMDRCKDTGVEEIDIPQNLKEFETAIGMGALPAPGNAHHKATMPEVGAVIDDNTKEVEQIQCAAALRELTSETMKSQQGCFNLVIEQRIEHEKCRHTFEGYGNKDKACNPIEVKVYNIKGNCKSHYPSTLLNAAAEKTFEESLSAIKYVVGEDGQSYSLDGNEWSKFVSNYIGFTKKFIAHVEKQSNSGFSYNGPSETEKDSVTSLYNKYFSTTLTLPEAAPEAAPGVHIAEHCVKDGDNITCTTTSELSIPTTHTISCVVGELLENGTCPHI
jgi:hypothetical protein